jgi:uncharacterized damage-inducible protein DinB
MDSKLPEPWLRGTLTDVPAVQRAVLHALELAKEDLHRWCVPLSVEQLNRTHANIPSVAFHIRHIVGSIDRLLTYAEGRELTPLQLEALRAESTPAHDVVTALAELDSALDRTAERIRAFSPAELEQPRSVGKKRLPATLGGLLVHIADHTQRHVGQAITTAKLVQT